MYVHKLPVAAPSVLSVAPLYRTLEQAAQHCRHFWRADDAFITKTGTAITTIADLSDNGGPMHQSLTGRYPQVFTDPQSGRTCADFSPARTHFMTCDAEFDPRAACTLFALVWLSKDDIAFVPNRANASILGRYDTEASNRAFINVGQDNGLVQSFWGDDGAPEIAFPGMPYRDREWQLVMASYRGSGGDGANRLRVNGEEPASGPVLTEPAVDSATGSQLQIGITNSGFASFVGRWMLGGVADVDLLAESEADKLADIVNAITVQFPEMDTLALNRPY